MARRAGGAGTRPKRPSSPTGFTLVEIVVTLVILAIMAAVAVPAFRSSRQLGDLDYSADRVEALLRLARDSAVRSAAPVTVLIDSASSLVWLTTAGSAGTAGAGSTGAQTTGEGSGLLGDAEVGSLFDRTGGGVEGALGAGTSLDLPLGVRLELTSARARFAFQPSGSAFPDSVFLVSSTGTRMVTVNPRTGHALIF